MSAVCISSFYLIGLSFIKARTDYKKNIKCLPVYKIEQYGKELQEYLNSKNLDVNVSTSRGAIIITGSNNFDWFKTVKSSSDEKEFWFITCETSTKKLRNKFLCLLPVEVATEINNWISSSLCQ